MATDIGLDFDSLIGKASNDRIKLTEYVDESVDLRPYVILRMSFVSLTVIRVLNLRQRSSAMMFMRLKTRKSNGSEGVVTNVTAFGLLWTSVFTKMLLRTSPSSAATS